MRVTSLPRAILERIQGHSEGFLVGLTLSEPRFLHAGARGVTESAPWLSPLHWDQEKQERELEQILSDTGASIVKEPDDLIRYRVRADRCLDIGSQVGGEINSFARYLVGLQSSFRSQKGESDNVLSRPRWTNWRISGRDRLFYCPEPKAHGARACQIYGRPA